MYNIYNIYKQANGNCDAIGDIPLTKLQSCRIVNQYISPL